MRLPVRLSFLFLVGIFAAGSTALGYYYYFVYHPPLETAEQFITAMETQDAQTLKSVLLVSPSLHTGQLREPTDDEIMVLLSEPFQRGRILDQRKREGGERDYYYLVYREPDGRVYALLVTSRDERFQVVIPERRMTPDSRYLWEYTWTN